MSKNQPRRTFFLPQCWPLSDLMEPHRSVSESLLVLHDMAGDGEVDCDYARQTILTFSDELHYLVELTRSAEGDIIFEIDLDGVPLGYRKEVNESPTLAELLESAWDVAADCTVGTDWMDSWYATHLLIAPWSGKDGENKVVVRCTPVAKSDDGDVPAPSCRPRG